ncbi:hypothetical protein Xen7305DRAFT_00009440 [Xenococcus sp. PCC 7305]|uniref:hypothetical protein n=1 Tax=Xenococcus sp. PCC 7305 TaxID=102125 RepID=UPI0002AC35AE|nr:hypothetical protein [Xenococcus sp. PCC 7305]ELS01241.1 hypothetical protein Xen7305DRAFT_00009440 [Xenococcus sp. PCC 7305]
MNKPLLITLSTVCSILVFGNSIGANEDKNKDHHQHNHQEFSLDESTDMHHHGIVVIDEGQPVPNVDLVVYEDTVKGWNLEIKLENFQLTPQDVNSENKLNQGHAHLFVNGNKVTRLYGNWYYLDNLPTGSNEVKVSLNANSHESLMHQGKMIEDVEIIEVK